MLQADQLKVAETYILRKIQFEYFGADIRKLKYNEPFDQTRRSSILKYSLG